MRRAAVLVPLLSLGCNASFIAALAPETDGGTDAGSSMDASPTQTVGTDGSTSDDLDASGSNSNSTDGPPLCMPPDPLAACDAAADPLRAPEIACYDDVAAARFESLDPAAWRRAHELGNANWVSSESDAILVLSTGTLPEPGMVGEVYLDPAAAELSPSDNANPDGVALPGDIDPAADSVAPAFGGAADDLVWLSFDATVPAGARGYAIRVGFLSAAYPEDLAADVSDLFVWWHESQAHVGNLALWNGAPATVAGLGPRMHAFAGEHPMLLRTGMDGTTGELCDIEGQSVNCPIGAATGWMELRGPAEPGEVIHVTAALLDQDTLARDTLVALDAFRWTCTSCVPGEDCGLQ